MVDVRDDGDVAHLIALLQVNRRGVGGVRHCPAAHVGGAATASARV